VERKKIPLISSITLKAATLSERYEFTSTPIYLALGVILSLLLFPAPINYASVAIVFLGDSAASIFGKLFGKTAFPLNKGKSLEGFLAGFALAFLSATIFLRPIQAFVGAVIGMFVESLPLPVNDNLSTPLATGVVLSFLPF
jgi:dolichol kinase